MEKNITIIEERIYLLRVKNHFTQSDVAKMLGVSRSLINNWENGFSNISLKQLIKLAYFYQVPIDYLLGIIDQIDHHSYHYVSSMNLKNIGLKLREIRKINRLTQDEFAQKIDTKRSSISYYEIGKMMISTADLKQICETFGVSADYIVGNLDHFVKRNKKEKIKLKDIKEKISIK